MSTPPPPVAAEFPRFDVVSDPSDHSFLSATKAPHSIPLAASRCILREWKILEEHLPDSIYVRVYEDQIDILRAVIVGAAGTPYHDGLYFFDIAFPTDYPTSPPEVRYRSSGLSINPNLHADGVVCLSLLNTWAGTSAEKWNPGESTILQVLLSIQGLVLNEKPCFNEPLLGIVAWMIIKDRERWSDSHNEIVLVQCWKTMLSLIRNPPRNFQGFVRSHFKERGVGILKAMEAYANGECRVGHYGTTEGVKGEPSARFKMSMLELQVKLSAEFAKVGASVTVEDFEDKSARLQILLEKEDKKEKKKKDEEEKIRVLIKWLLGIQLMGLFLYVISRIS